MYSSLTRSNREVKSPNTRKYDAYFVPKRNVIHERPRFPQRTQNQGDFIAGFVHALYEIAENCDFGNKDEHIRDRLVIGILDKDISERLQMKGRFNVGHCNPNVTTIWTGQFTNNGAGTWFE